MQVRRDGNARGCEVEVCGAGHFGADSAYANFLAFALLLAFVFPLSLSLEGSLCYRFFLCSYGNARGCKVEVCGARLLLLLLSISLYYVYIYIYIYKIIIIIIAITIIIIAFIIIIIIIIIIRGGPFRSGLRLRQKGVARTTPALFEGFQTGCTSGVVALVVCALAVLALGIVICSFKVVSVYIYIYIYICIHTYIHTYTHTHTHTYIHTYIHTYTYTYVYIYTYIYIYIYSVVVWSHLILWRSHLSPMRK